MPSEVGRRTREWDVLEAEGRGCPGDVLVSTVGEAQPLGCGLRRDYWYLQPERVHWGRTNGNYGFALKSLKHRETLRKINVGLISSDGFTCFFLLILIT